MDENVLTGVFEMLIERLGKVEDSQQSISKTLERLERQQFATFIHSTHSSCEHCCINDFFHCAVSLIVNNPTMFFRSKYIYMIELTLRSPKPLGLEVQKKVTDLMPEIDFGLRDLSVCFDARQSFPECCDHDVGLFDFYKALVRCVNEYVAKVSAATGLRYESGRITKVVPDDSETEGSDEE